MKKTLFLFLFLPFISLSQENPVNSVNWTTLAEAEKYSEKYKIMFKVQNVNFYE